jgi:hypothetical protein
MQPQIELDLPLKALEQPRTERELLLQGKLFEELQQQVYQVRRQRHQSRGTRLLLLRIQG